MLSKEKIISTFVNWLPLGVAITVLAGTVYLVEQQNLRIGANDPQIQIAEDTAAELADGKQPQSFDSAVKVDLSSSLAPFIILYDNSGRPQVSSVQLEGKIPTVPAGVFTDAQAKGELRFTWQPKAWIRNAVVIKHYNGTQSGFVLAGRSLREVEKREDALLLDVSLGLAAALILSFLTSFSLQSFKKGKV